MLLFGKPPQEPPPPMTRNKTGVVAIVKKAPAGQKHDLAWWLQWLKANW